MKQENKLFKQIFLILITILILLFIFGTKQLFIQSLIYSILFYGCLFIILLIKHIKT